MKDDTFERLDKLLLFFITTPSIFDFELTTLAMNGKLPYNRDQIIEAANHLADNDYLSSTKTVDGKAVFYTLKLKGKVFIKNGGYITSYGKARNQMRIQSLKDWLLIVGTILAGIGTLALFGWEIYKHYWLHLE